MIAIDCECEFGLDEQCEACLQEAGLLKTSCMRCDWFGIPINADGMASILCNVCEYLHPTWEDENDNR